jgi:hypothetical protein
MADFTIKGLLSRLYSVQRGVISPKYAMTDAMLKKLRGKAGTIGKSIKLDLKKGGKINKKKNATTNYEKIFARRTWRYLFKKS